MRRSEDRSRADASPAAASPAAAVPVLDTLHGEGHLVDVDLHFGRLIAELDGGGSELPLAAALVSAWTRDGHACLALSEVAGRDWPRTGAGAVRLPALEPWIEALDASPLVARPGDGERCPLVLDRHGRLYLERLRTAEQAVADGLRRLAGDDAGVDPEGLDAVSGDRTPERGPRPGPEGLDAALDRLFPGTAPGDRPREAARIAVCRRLCVVSGGPGTGKTTTAAAIVALFIELGLAVPARIALAAPTGKAAARLQEAVRGQRRALLSRAPALEGFEARATTVHRWLGHRAREGSGTDVLILDEGSMVDLTLMAQVLHALPDGARLVLLGDASQLASVQPGSVFADLCRDGGGIGGGAGDEGARAASGTEAVAPETGGIAAGADRAGSGIGQTATGAGIEETRKAGRGSAVSSLSPAALDEASESAPSGVAKGPRHRSPLAWNEPAPRPPAALDEASESAPSGVAKRPRHRSSLAWNEPAPRPPAALDEASKIARGGIAKHPRQRSPLATCVVELVRNWRFDEKGGLGRLAAAVARGDASAAVAALRDPSDTAVELRALPDAAAFERLAVRFADERFVPALQEARQLRGPSDEGAGPLPSFRVLCAHRIGPFGAERFNRSVEKQLRDLGLVGAHDPFYPGRPILVTRNDPRTRLSNGDTGVVLRDVTGRAQVWFPELEDADGGPRLVPPARLPPHESFFALTVHRAQGSEYDEVAVVPGPADSRVATRELLYTAVTRARRRVVVYGVEESVAAAVERPTERSSGLRDALAEAATGG